MNVPLVEKRLTPRARTEPEAVARLRAEAALLRRLGGRVTPHLHDEGEDEHGPFFRMERVPFPTLSERLAAAAGPLGADWVERAFRASLAALAILHEGEPRVVHADLSPSNLAVDDEGGRVVLLDLGLSCFDGAPPRDGAFRGTLAYAAPEIARGELPTVRSDLFSLAAVFLHVATGAPPRAPTTFAAGLATAAECPVLEDRHLALAARGRGHAAMIACLAHEPEGRPASAREAC